MIWSAGSLWKGCGKRVDSTAILGVRSAVEGIGVRSGCQAFCAALPVSKHLRVPTRPRHGYQAKSLQCIPLIFRYRVSGTVVRDRNASQWKLATWLARWLWNNNHLHQLSRTEWQFREMNFTVFVDFSFNSNRVHIVDDTLQR